jgi:FKBP-type peptidyl-prolyl cis-trans isomerase FkpA
MIINQKNVLAFICSTIIFMSAGCLKNDSKTTSNCVTNTTGVPTAAEIASLQTYITANNITATLDPRGFFYTIVNAGSGPKPLLSSTVFAKYVGKLDNGTVFESRQDAGGVSFLLGGVISGWQFGVPLIRKGGTVTLYLPPTLGYGCNAQAAIPAGSNLIFTIDLVDVQ